MNADSLSRLFASAAQAQKYVWLKHQFDRNPLLDTFSLNDDGSLDVGLYCSWKDGYEGLMTIDAESVEWAYVSQQAYLPAMSARLENATSTGTLVRLVFSDFLGHQLFHCTSHAIQRGDWHTEHHFNVIAYGHFVQDHSFSSNPQRSRIPLNVLLDIETTDIQRTSIKPRADFIESCCDPNLECFATDTTA